MMENSVFSIMAGLIADMLFMLLSINNAVGWAEYETYWLMDFLLINKLGVRKESFLIIFWSGMH